MNLLLSLPGNGHSYMGTRKNLQTNRSRFPLVQEWMEDQFAKGASALSITFAVSQIPFANDLADCCELNLSQFPVAAHSRQWHQFWMSSPAFWVKCLQEFDPALADDVLEWKNIDRLEFAESLFEDLQTATVSLRRAYGRLLQMEIRREKRQCLASLDETITGPADADIERIDLQHNDAFLFLARIYFPALARYGLPPDTLYHQAIEGDTQSLTRVLELDPSAESLPGIRDALWDILKRKRPSPLSGERPQLVRTLGFKRRSCKTQIMAWIRDYSRLLATAVTPNIRRFVKSAFGVSIHPSRVFTVPDLQRLFDASSRDQTGYVDADLTGGPEAIKKMVDRAAKSFSLQHWDIFSAKTVPVKGECSA